MANGLHNVRHHYGVLQVGEGFLEELHHDWHETAHEVLRETQELLSGTDCAAQDPAQNVATPFVRGPATISNGHHQCPHVIGHNAVRRVDTADVGVANTVGVGREGGVHRLHRGEDGGEEVRAVVRVRPIKGGNQPLETHTGVNVQVRKLFETVLALVEELHEHEVPDFDELGVINIDQLWDTAAADVVVVQFRTRPTGPGITHLPEVVLHAPGNDALHWNTEVDPDLTRLVVWREAKRLAAFEIGGIQSPGVEVEHVHQELPSVSTSRRLTKCSPE